MDPRFAKTGLENEICAEWNVSQLREFTKSRESVNPCRFFEIAFFFNHFYIDLEEFLYAASLGRRELHPEGWHVVRIVLIGVEGGKVFGRGPAWKQGPLQATTFCDFQIQETWLPPHHFHKK